MSFATTTSKLETALTNHLGLSTSTTPFTIPEPPPRPDLPVRMPHPGGIPVAPPQYHAL
jgi:hypothetical protein